MSDGKKSRLASAEAVQQKPIERLRQDRWPHLRQVGSVTTDDRTSQALLMESLLEKLFTTGAIRVEDGV